jgi:HlyD family secretion protein
VEIKTGISDGVMTEVLEGLEEGQEVVTATLAPDASRSSTQTANPFGGGPGFRRF